MRFPYWRFPFPVPFLQTRSVKLRQKKVWTRKHLLEPQTYSLVVIQNIQAVMLVPPMKMSKSYNNIRSSVFNQLIMYLVTRPGKISLHPSCLRFDCLVIDWKSMLSLC